MNECVEAALGGSDLCETDTTMRYCINTVGGYMCICPDGVEQRGDTCVNLGMNKLIMILQFNIFMHVIYR